MLAIASVLSGYAASERIDRRALVERNSPQVMAVDKLQSLSVGNGEFAFTVDATGLQTFPNSYKDGVPLGTQSQWGWHSFDNPQALRPEETWREYDFGRGHMEPYATQISDDERRKAASDWYRLNPHRLHLGIIGFALDEVTAVNQRLDLWSGTIRSCFSSGGHSYNVLTAVHPERNMVAAAIESAARTPVVLRFPYPTGGHSDDGCRWDADEQHSTELVAQGDGYALLRRTLGTTTYYVSLRWEGTAALSQTATNAFLLTPATDRWAFTAEFMQPKEEKIAGEALSGACSADMNNTHSPCSADVFAASAAHWQAFWENGAAVDFSACTDARAAELERRVVLSQYLLAIQCAGSTPPQETGLTYNSWFGKFHLEMIWWHQAQFALWGRPQLLERTLRWYERAEPMARQIAQRQGFDGVRWMKMTDPNAGEAPSKVGSFLIWQQPHLIYLAELVYRATGDTTLLTRYGRLIDATATFMASFASLDGKRPSKKQADSRRYVLKGCIPAQETLRAAETVNPPFELSYWHFALQVAQQWRERRGMERCAEWDNIVARLSPLAYNSDHLYLAAETATDTYTDIRFTSDHMAVLGSLGILPKSRLVTEDYMRNTLHWIWDNWNWDKTWGWDYPMTAMNAARLGEPDKAVGALLMDKRTNTYLVNGHNYQDDRLRCYLPGNGGLLTAIAMMCAGWDGCPANTPNPGFPNDGTWNVKWEGLLPMP